MTLIVSCITRDYVSQVADRRLTYFNERNELIRFDDDANKLVCFENRLIIAYTGMAFLENKKTDIWIAEIIQYATTTNEVIDCLARGAESAIQKIRSRLPPSAWSLLAHTFSIVGWEIGEDQRNYIPVAMIVSNNEDYVGNNLPEVSHVFSVRRRFLAPNEIAHIESCGQKTSFTPHMEEQIRGRIRRSRRKNGSGIPPIVTIARLIRTVSFSNSTVGRGVLAVTLPNTTLLPSYAFVTFSENQPSTEVPWFIEFRVDDERTIQSGPIFVNRTNQTDPERHVIINKIEIAYGDSIDRYKEKVIPAPPPSALILSSWTYELDTPPTFPGRPAGSWVPKLSEDYTLESCTVMTDTSANTSPEHSPYYGTVVAVVTTEPILSQIRSDPRYLVVSEPCYEKLHPTSQWLRDTQDWLVHQGMPEATAAEIMTSIQSLTHEEIDLALRHILSVPKPDLQ